MCRVTEEEVEVSAFPEACVCPSPVRISDRSTRLVIGSPFNFDDGLIGSPIASRRTGAQVTLELECQASGDIRAAVDAALPVAPITCGFKGLEF